MTGRVITKTTIEQFEAYLHKEERSNGTVDNYIRNVRELAAWLAGQAVTKEQLVAWKDALQAKRLQPTTVNAKLAAIGCFSASHGVAGLSGALFAGTAPCIPGKRERVDQGGIRKASGSGPTAGERTISLAFGNDLCDRCTS